MDIYCVVNGHDPVARPLDGKSANILAASMNHQTPVLELFVVEKARRVRRFGEVFVLERLAQGGGASDLSCLE